METLKNNSYNALIQNLIAEFNKLANSWSETVSGYVKSPHSKSITIEDWNTFISLMQQTLYYVMATRGALLQLEEVGKALEQYVSVSEVSISDNGILSLTFGSGNSKESSGALPRIRINADNEWEISTDGGKTWVSTGVKATGANGQNGQDGADGADGKDGVGVESIVQTTTSNADGGTNEITVTLTNGAKATFNVKNGSKGSEGPEGPEGKPGTGFSISKTYSSVEKMREGFDSDGVPFNGFVLIDTGNVNDEDNAKLFVKLQSGYSYLTDLSGAQGIKGEQGEQGEQGVSIIGVTLTEEKGLDFTMSNDSHLYTDSVQGPAGEKYELTEADKTDIADKVLNSLPVAERGSF